MKNNNLRIHYLQHEPFEGIGCIADWIAINHHTVTGTHLYTNDVLPDVENIDVLIVMGGAMNIYEETKYQWLAAEKHFIKQCIAQNKVVVGICLGAQLIASILGAKVTKNKVKEIGWYPIVLTEKARQSELFKEQSPEITVFHWHGDTFDLPEGALHLATSEGCLQQAYLYREKVLGLQFHLEVTLETLTEMTREMDDELREKSPFIQDVEVMRNGTRYIESRNTLMFGILDALTESIMK